MIICKYKFDSSIYSNLIPEFNSGYTGYTVSDEVNGNIVTRTIECDVLPTLMRFGQVYVDGETQEDYTRCLLEVLDMNTSELTSCYSMFRYCTNLTSINCNWNTNNVTTMQSMFDGCTNLTSLDVSNFDTSNVTNMNSMFYNCTNLTQLDVSNFNTSNVATMYCMFYDCNNLTQLDVSNWNTGKVIDMFAMFHQCTSLTSLDLSNFNTSEVTNMHAMFWGCQNLTSLDVSNFNTSKVTRMTSFAGWLSNVKTLNLNNLHVTNEKTIVDGDDRFLLNTAAEKIYLNDLDTLNTVMRFLPDRTGKESGKLVTSLRNKIPTETLTTLASKNWKIVDLVAQYRYDANTYEDLIPEFNTEFISDKYEVYDSVSEIVIDNMKWEEGSINPDGKDSPLSGRLRTNFLPVLPNITYKTSGDSINFHWYDSNKTYIASGHKYASSCVSPTNAKYVRFHNSTNEVNVISAKLITRSIESKNGDLPTLMRFGGTEDSNSYSSLIEVFDLNTKELTDCSYMFGKCCNVKNIRAYWNTSNVTSIRAMFYRCNNLTSLDVSNWDTSSVTNMSGIFSGGDLSDASLIEIVGLETWDTSSVLDMSLMFYNRKSLTTLDVSKFDTSNVNNMYCMFYNCTNLTQLDVSNFNTSNVTTMESMFNGCKNLTQLDVSNFDTSSATNMSYMFNYCTNLTSLDISNFNVINVTDFTNFLTNTKIKLIKCLNPSTINTLIQYLPNKSSSSNGTIIIDNRNGLNTNELTNKNWSIISTSDEYIVAKYKYDKSIYFNLIPTFNSGYDSYFIYNEYNDEDDNIVTRKIVSNVLPTLMRFGSSDNTGTGDYTRESSLLEVMKLITDNLNDMSLMFYRCINLTQLDVSNFDTSKVHNMGYMFTNCNNLTQLDVSNWNTSNVTNMARMFYNCNNLTQLDVSNFNTSNVTDMGDMFCNCSKLTLLDVSNFDTSKAANIAGMFNTCSKLTSLNVSKFNTSNVANICYMFYGCTNLTQLDLSNFNTSNVNNMGYMFSNCTNLTSLDLSNFNTSNVTSMSNMFNGCNNLTSLDLSNFNTSKVNNTQNIFNNTPKLVNIGMLYCSPSTINTISSNLSNPTTVWINGNIIKSELTSYDNITYEIYYYEKELLLNSPLLEGDKIVKKDGKIYHYHKMGMIVLDGSESWWIPTTSSGEVDTNWETETHTAFRTSALINPKDVVWGGQQTCICDRFKVGVLNDTTYSLSDECIGQNRTRLDVKISKSKLSTQDTQGFKQWLQVNPLTVVYELANPYYELISEDKDLSLTLPSTDNILTNNSLIPTNMNVKNNSMSTVGINNSSTYTVVFDKDTDNNIVVNLNGTSIETSDNRVEITTSNELSENELTFIGEGEISNVRILDGSVSGDNIPRESFEGLKSSFEDGHIPNPLYTHLDEFTITRESSTWGHFTDSDSLFVNNRVYTLFMEVLENSLNNPLIWELTQTYASSRLTVNPGQVGIFVGKVDAPGNSIDSTVWVSGANNSSEGEARIGRCYAFEGDWTHLSPEDFEHLGQYKVEYKVTGKNKWRTDLIESFEIPEGSYYMNSGYRLSELCPELVDGKWYKASFDYDRTGWTQGTIGIAIVIPDYVEFSDTDGFMYRHTMKDSFVYFYGGNLYNTFTNIQLEEGTVSTEYEPHKSYTKTFYLNSPLLEGDTIEDINGVATHVHRMGKVVLDGSEEGWIDNSSYYPSDTTIMLKWYKKDFNISVNNTVISDDFSNRYISDHTNIEGIFQSIGASDSNNNFYGGIYLRVYKSRLSTPDLDGFKQWLSNNPTTVVYELAQPWNEPIGAYGKIVLDGSEDEVWKVVTGDSSPVNTNYIRFYIDISDIKTSDYAILNCDKFTIKHGIDKYAAEACISSHNEKKRIDVCINKSRLSTPDLDGFKQWLQQSPVTVTYELAESNPVEPLLLDSYVNGHLDFDSTVPVEKVEFKYIDYQNYLLNCQYAHPNTTYTIQFESDNVGKLDMIHFAGTYLYNLNVVKGINRYSITTPNQVNSAYFTMRGIGFNASNIQVVATDRDNIKYFKGMESSFEDCTAKSKNLFNKEIIFDYGIDQDGTVSSDSTVYSSEYIECKPNTPYICNYGTGIHYFDKDKRWISYLAYGTPSPSNAKYLVKCISKTANLNTVQIEEGVVVTGYEPYSNKYKVEVSMVGKNKFNGWKIGGIDWNTGENNNEETDRIRTDYIKVKPNNVYHLNAKDCYCELTHLFMYDFNKKFISFIQTSSTIFSIPTNCYYIKILNMNADTFVNYKNYNFQLEEGEVATEYKPYKETRETIYLNSPLLKGDRIEMYNGKLCHYHKMGKVVLNGSEDWRDRWNDVYGIEKHHIFHTTIQGIKKENGISDMFICGSLSSLGGECVLFAEGAEGEFGINIGVSRLLSEDVNGFKQWLSNNPTTVVYELAEPYYEEITPEHNEFTIVSIGESSFTIDSGNVPTDSEVTYNVNVKLLNDLEENMNSNTSSTNVDLTTILDDIINE